MGEVQVKLSVKDEVTPALRRISRQVWIMENAENVYRFLMVLMLVVGLLGGFILGRLV